MAKKWKDKTPEQRWEGLMNAVVSLRTKIPLGMWGREKQRVSMKHYNARRTITNILTDVAERNQFLEQYAIKDVYERGYRVEHKKPWNPGEEIPRSHDFPKGWMRDAMRHIEIIFEKAQAEEKKFLASQA